MIPEDWMFEELEKYAKIIIFAYVIILSIINKLNWIFLILIVNSFWKTKGLKTVISLDDCRKQANNLSFD